MFAKQIAIDSDTVVHTLKACSQIGDLKTAFEVLNKMKDFKIEKNKYIYN
jgi:pentatricopeptide repeat protein